MPVNRKDTIENVQTIRVLKTELMLQNIDRSRKDIQKWYRSLQNAEQISCPNRSQLYDLYERVKLDGHLSGIIEKRRAALLNKVMHYEINGKRVDAMESFIQSEKFRELRRNVFDRKVFGIVGFEFNIGTSFDFTVIPRKHIKPEGKLIAVEQNGNDGFYYPDYWNVVVSEDAEKFGVLLNCCPYAIWKSGNLGDLSSYIENFGQPMKIAKYPPGNDDAKSSSKQALKETGAGTSMTMPDDVAIEIIGDHVTNGTGEVHERMIKICNNEMSVKVLGNTETTSNENGGSYNKSKEHSKQQLEITKTDMVDQAEFLSSDQMKRIFKSYNLPLNEGDGGAFVFEKEIDLNALELKKDIDISLNDIIPIDPDYWYNKYDIPKPDNFQQLYKEMQAQKKLQNMPKQQSSHPFPIDEDEVSDADLFDKLGKKSFWNKLRDLFFG